jgi:hypothetical protein
MIAPHPARPRERYIHPLLLILLIVLAVLAFPVLVYGVFVAAMVLMPGGMD